MILENLEHIVLITGTIVNCYIAFEIFKLNKKESNPKLIITANQKEVGDFFMQKQYFLKN